ncbi:hypothetical protein [Paraliomyxa miuraensis]|uniref:hypothetical protein n=1 Tax=Paraliomyxa miuraensis TaxID=376150 RepID=UPI002258D327|nr:hypothetical protein [Paraliomyxa miuraensis]MCX4246699.1 hypothetical protein [Paraliomyxa miuraensis]
MRFASPLALFASLALPAVLALPGCMAKNAPHSSPGGGGFASPADGAESAPGPMATRGDFGGRHSARQAPPAADQAASEAYGGDGGHGAYEPHDYDYEDSTVASTPSMRPGLGTSYGEQHFSQVTTAPFVRGSSQPDVLLSLWYNDVDGIRQAQGTFGNGFDQVSQSSTSDGVFVVSVVDEYGYAMSAAQVGDKRYVAGQPGQRYKLRVQNNSAYRYEVVASVDGLDVIDGDTASFAKRGYIVDPWATITIDGWRTGDDSVAAFRFSAMEDSYADRKGQGRNIGVVGFAFFHERGGVPWQELHRRDNADPFPNRYAEPPPPRRIR